MNLQRARNWAFVAYPESLPEDWINILSEYHIPAFISPLHDKDVNAEGEVKKAHYHIILMYSGKKSFEQVIEVTDSLNATRPEVCHDVTGYARYLIHLDETDPNKYHYDKNEVKALSGADYENAISLPIDSKSMKKEIEVFIVENNFRSYSKFLMWCIQNEKDDWHDFVTRQTVHFKTFLHSLEYDDKNGLKK